MSKKKHTQNINALRNNPYLRLRYLHSDLAWIFQAEFSLWCSSMVNGQQFVACNNFFKGLKLWLKSNKILSIILLCIARIQVNWAIGIGNVPSIIRSQCSSILITLFLVSPSFSHFSGRLYRGSYIHSVMKSLQHRFLGWLSLTLNNSLIVVVGRACSKAKFLHSYVVNVVILPGLIEMKLIIPC